MTPGIHRGRGGRQGTGEPGTWIRWPPREASRPDKRVTGRSRGTRDGEFITISFARLGRVAGVAVTAVSLTGALAGTASAVTFTGHDAHARAVAPSPAVSGNAMCLDASTPPRRNGGPVYLWQCEPGNTNQAWVIDGGQIIVKDTLS